MRLPRDLSGNELVKRLQVLGYTPTRQRGSHVRVTTQQNGEHHITVPRHNPLRLGTLSGILQSVADHFALTRNEVLERIMS
jgi:predicted RNA binding protein YcfA (HicA-like mRNA interferase family)